MPDIESDPKKIREGIERLAKAKADFKKEEAAKKEKTK